jgi:Protein of unknown function (DUF3089)
MQRRWFSISWMMLSVSFSCTPKYAQYVDHYAPLNASQPDYGDYNYWAAHPYKHDPSDSIPLPLRKDYRYDSTVDVFFIHPTTFTQKEETSWNATLSDVNLNAKTDYSTILFQASAFNEYRVFAPRYRQAHLRSYFSADEAALHAFDTAYEDVKAAFVYYLEHSNNNRPIIIASHSQGTTHAKRLLKEFFEDKPLAGNLVAAYLIGMYIPQNYFTALQLCTDSMQTGCVCAWRSFQNNYIPDFVENEKGTGAVVNPLLWTTESSYAPKTLNRGAVLRNFNKVYYQVADAKINEGVLWINKPDFPGSIFIRMKNYHVADINFFYINIRENLRQRVEVFKTKSR